MTGTIRSTKLLELDKGKTPEELKADRYRLFAKLRKAQADLDVANAMIEMLIEAGNKLMTISMINSKEDNNDAEEVWNSVVLEYRRRNG